MIWNIVDRRKHEYRWKAITAIVEPTYHDNSCQDSDQAEETVNDLVYDQRPEISLADAVAWAQSLSFAATLYLYDLGQGINTVTVEKETDHFRQTENRFEKS